MSDAEALVRLGEMIDRAADTTDEKLNDTAITCSEHLQSRDTLAGESRVLLHYFRANAFENRLGLSGEAQSWAWDIPHFEHILLELRKAVAHEAFGDLNPIRQCQIFTNLANRLNAVGRPVEALAHWDRAIAINPRFAMALANRGYGLGHYGNSLYDGGHFALFMLSSHDSLSAASSKDAEFESPDNYAHKQMFELEARRAAERVNIDGARANLTQEFSLGRSRAERQYRSWCLGNRLFLNPLNDLGDFSIAAHDVLHLPSLTLGIDESGAEPPVAFGFYNQLKQEFVAARWLFFEGMTEKGGHFSDKGNHLYDTLNIPSYSLGTEKTKLAFRMAYSLFDKIAFFINDYFKVGLGEKEVSFRSIWSERKGHPKPLRTVFDGRRNWSLRGLYWLSKDLYEPTFQDVAEPEARGMAHLRNHLEHKYCQVHEDLGIGYSIFATAQNGRGLGFRIGREELDSKTLHILKLARAALIYLSLAVHREEQVGRARGDGALVVSMPLMTWNERGRL
ncbi:LA2681 family HEPN domain-containing protein [Parerythrobacter lacustris]|uniref:LA2681 family HEPN domain-containing protein n=1 Tax=Parerythrobacter lacustris TaxID=2969984 RepID=A0ABT1XQA4_9SPHN|nr:LA2681 family HEPN domain-containing protein [Parerythrobacter lacustris]MCR2833828.1 LA2681 family HEPN domain-containing protein [Parerythrobacter lacustris]